MLGRGLGQDMEVSGGCRKCQRGPETSFFLPTFVLEKSLIYQLIGFKNLEHLPHSQQPTQPPIWSYMGRLYVLSSHTGGCSVWRMGLLLPWERRKGEAGLGGQGRNWAADLWAKPERWAEQDATAVTRRNQNQTAGHWFGLVLWRQLRGHQVQCGYTGLYSHPYPLPLTKAVLHCPRSLPPYIPAYFDVS